MTDRLLGTSRYIRRTVRKGRPSESLSPDPAGGYGSHVHLPGKLPSFEMQQAQRYFGGGSPYGSTEQETGNCPSPMQSPYVTVDV